MLLNSFNEPQIQQSEIMPSVPGEVDKLAVSSKGLPDAEEESEPDLPADDIASQEDVLSALKEMYNDKNMQVKLTRFAKKTIYERLGKDGIKKITPGELVSEAINRIIDGNRTWDKKKRPNIVELIIMVIVSIARYEANKNSNTVNPLFNEVEAGLELKRKNFKPKFVPLEFKNEQDRHNENTVADIESARYNYNIYTDDEDAIVFDKYAEEVEIALSDDEEAFFVYHLRMEGIKEPREIAKTLEVEVSSVYNALKRIRRVIISVTKAE